MSRMPEISRFFGIVISMYYSEHGVPHFHALYREHKVAVELESGVIHGTFPHGRSASFGSGRGCTARSCWPTGSWPVGASPSIESRRWSDAMDYDVMEARYVRDYVVWVRFRDGTAGEVDLSGELRGPVFQPLRDRAYFRQFTVHPELQTLVWPNGADIAPEFLHDAVRVTT